MLTIILILVLVVVFLEFMLFTIQLAFPQFIWIAGLVYINIGKKSRIILPANKRFRMRISGWVGMIPEVESLCLT